ncbi:hypothetical protein Tco_0094078, partial [Tanacetum coccineum]
MLVGINKASTKGSRPTMAANIKLIVLPHQ